MNKANRLEELMDELLETFVAKNEDYGDSFADSFKEFGITSAVVRMNDKMNRIKSLSKKGDRQVKDESLRDSLMDLANYALMTVVELEDEGEEVIKPRSINITRDCRIIADGVIQAFDVKVEKSDYDDDELCDYEDEYNNDFQYTDEELGIDWLEDDKEYLLKSLADKDEVARFLTKFSKEDIKWLVKDMNVDLDDFEIIEVKSDYEAGRQENL